MLAALLCFPGARKRVSMHHGERARLPYQSSSGRERERGVCVRKREKHRVKIRHSRAPGPYTARLITAIGLGDGVIDVMLADYSND